MRKYILIAAVLLVSLALAGPSFALRESGRGQGAAEPEAAIGGQWDAQWQWDTGGGGDAIWTINQFGPFFSNRSPPFFLRCFFPLAFGVIMGYIIMYGSDFHIPKSSDHLRGCLVHPGCYCEQSERGSLRPFEENMPGLELGSTQRSSQRDDLPRAAVTLGKRRLY